MFNEDNVLNTVSRAINNCIFCTYGNIGYFTGIEKNSFTVEIYNLPSKTISQMSDDKKKEHLLKSIEIQFDSTLYEYGIIDFIVTKVESILYED